MKELFLVVAFGLMVAAVVNLGRVWFRGANINTVVYILQLKWIKLGEDGRAFVLFLTAIFVFMITAVFCAN